MSMALEPEVRSKVLRDTAEKMMTAARTAPKARGIDNLVISAAYGDTIKLIAEKMKELVKEGKGPDYFVRDADNILSAEIVVLLGTRIDPLGIKFCGYCGHKNCAEKNNHPDQPCALNTNERVDNRIMHSIGVAVRELGLLDKDVRIIYGIPLSIGAKNPFFDRK